MTHTVPRGALSIAQILNEARSHLERISPERLLQELQNPDSTRPTHLVDIRPAAQREREGALTFPQDVCPGHQIHIIERNVLEWRLDPQADSRLKSIVDASGYDTRVVVACSEGYTSSLAARELQRLGLRNATDLNGGFWAWKHLMDTRTEIRNDRM